MWSRRSRVQVPSLTPKEVALSQLSLLNNRVCSQLDLKDVDLDFFDLVDSEGPITPSALARRTGVHRGTITGILDRLERGGWIARERDPEDRRAVRVAIMRER